MKRLLIAFFLAALALSAADVSGQWSGKWEGLPGGEQPHYMVLKQDGDAVTGTAGPDASKQFDIRNGRISGDKLSFEVAVDSGPLMKFEFKIDGDSAAGQAHVEYQGKTLNASLSAKRVK